MYLESFSYKQMDIQVPVVTSTFPVDRSCLYREGSFPYFKGLADSILYVLALWTILNISFS